MTQAESRFPGRALCVDLDGTLVATDTLVESVVLLLKSRPWLFPWACVALFRDRAYAKSVVARRAPIEPSVLPYRQEVLDLIRDRRDRGDRIVLATASNRRTADAVAEYLGCFDLVVASDDRVNLKGAAKVDAIRGELGEMRWDYVGDSSADLPVWQAADGAILVAVDRSTAQAVSAHRPDAQTLVPPAELLKPALRGIRVHQWSKNLLLLVPMLTGHLVTAGNLLTLFWAILSMGLCASSVYLLNDLFDAPSDRRHPRKKHRPIASGALPLSGAAVMVLVGLVLSFTLAWIGVGPAFLGMVGAYLILTTGYSVLLRSKPMIDVITLASLYTLRLIAGGVAIGVQVSHWLLVFSMFLFLSLAFAKRYAELMSLGRPQAQHRVRGRGYMPTDLPLLGVFGPVSGYLAVLVFVMYLNSNKVAQLYREPYVLWLVCPILLYWVGRTWLITTRGRMHDDPVVYAIKDPGTYMCAFLILLFGVLAGPL